MRLKVKPSTKLVAVAIASHAGATSGLSWPSLGTLSAETGLSRRQVVYSVRALERGGHLTITRLRVGKVNRSNRYRIPQLAGSAKPGGGGAQAALGGGAQVAPEPVRTSEPVKVHTRARLACEPHGRSWFATDGTGCFECARERMAKRDTKSRPRAGALPVYTYHDRPPRESAPLTAEQRTAISAQLLATGWQQKGTGQWARF